MTPLRFINKMSKFQPLKIKYINDLTPAVLVEVFKVNETISYGLRMRKELHTKYPKKVIYDTETIFSLSQKIWVLSRQDIRDSSSYTYLKRVLENKNPTAHAVYAKQFGNNWFYIPHQQFLIYLKFK